jgi:hypothetical protein
MLKHNAYKALAGIPIAAGLWSAAAAQQIVVREVYIERPPRTIAIVTGVNVASDTIQLFRDANFEDEAVLMNVSAAQPAGQSHELPSGMEDSLSSLRWSLPAGVLVVMYEDDGSKGEQLALWGSGQIDALSTFDFDNKASQWAWYYVGAAREPSEVIVRGQALPVGSVTVTVPAAADSITLYKSKDFATNTVTVSPMSHAANTLHRLPEDLPDSLTSMRWNLPPGVVVMFHQDAQGDKQQVAIWGNGQVADLDVWDFNDKASRWAWHYIGSPDVEVVGYVPPSDTKVVVVDKDAIDLVGRAMVPTELKVEVNDLVAKKNPVGEGTFVYVPRTEFSGVERHVIWIVMDGKAYALTGPAKLLTPTLTTPAQATDTEWADTGVNRLNAEQDAVKIVFDKKK